MKNIQFVIVKPELQREISWYKTEGHGLLTQSHPNATYKTTIEKEVFSGYMSGKLGIISPKVKEFYAKNGFNCGIEKEMLGTRITCPRPLIKNDSWEGQESNFGEYKPDKRDILILTYDPEQKETCNVEEKYSLVPLREKEIIPIRNPESLDQLIEEYRQNGLLTENTNNLIESYRWLNSFELLVERFLIDIREIPIRISTRK